MRIAVIDCGTNTFNLLVVDLNKSSFHSVHSSKIPVKLGEGGINHSVINEVPFKRGVDALMQFQEKIKELSVDHTHAFATSAIRDASNGLKFKEEVHRSSGINIHIIDGDKEADLIYMGNKLAVKLTEQPSLIMDIGGGSTEFIIGNKDQIFWKKSYRLGAARLLERFKPSDPITSEEIEQFNAYLNEQLTDLNEAVLKYKPVELIGSSGAFDSVTEMIHGQLNGEPFVKTKTEYEIALPDYATIAEKVIASTIQQRREMKGLVEMRVDMMVVSCLLISFIMNSYQLQKIRVSTYSLKEGALHEIMERNGTN
jgi:exopolyphosphatase/guanosine-5'-triphosphate,3'-diphosphate pyrophosphatase